jgi:hypothetical protein
LRVLGLSGDNTKEECCNGCKEYELEDRVYSDEYSTVFFISTCESIPDEDLQYVSGYPYLEKKKLTMAIQRATPTRIRP